MKGMRSWVKVLTFYFRYLDIECYIESLEIVAYGLYEPKEKSFCWPETKTSIDVINEITYM